MKSILNKHMHVCRALCLAITMLAIPGIKAQFVPEIFSVIRSGENVKARLSQSGSYANKIDTVTDNRYGELTAAGAAWKIRYKHRSVYNRISISIKDTTKSMQKFDYLFSMTIDTWDAKGLHGTFNVTMRFSYDPASHKAYIDKAVYQFRHCHRFAIKINSILDSALVNPASFSISTMQTNFNIESEIIVERYYKNNYSLPVTSITHGFTAASRLRISWTPPDTSSPVQYELEWAYVDTAGVHPDSVKYDFTHNSSRVLLSQTYYDINTVYDAGVILYRVRRVKPDSVYFKYNKYSNWKPSFASKGYIDDYTTNKVYITSHEAMGKNWDYQVAFAEKGLKKEVVNYFDGSLKRRQGVTLSNTNGFALVDESVYDHHGREAIKIIPAPSDSNTIQYYKKFNKNLAGAAYSAHDFDTSTTMMDKCNGNYKARRLDSTSGAGRYYSSNNPDKTGENAAIPDAAGYPMVQTQLMPDPTGRVLAQGGIGIAHQLGSGHETKYTYGTANQAELDRVFGNEVGIANHYKKNAVVDPNGQVSISYIDQHGRVVATSLTGGVPGVTDTLNNFVTSKYEMTDLTPNSRMKGSSIVVDYNFNVLTAGTHKIFYRLEAPDFLFGCLGVNQCYTCRYDLEVRLQSTCDTSALLYFKRPIGRLSDMSCSNLVFNLDDSVSAILGSVTTSGDSIAFTLAQGGYTLTKRLTVNTDSLAAKVEAVLAADSSCYKTITDFIDDELEKMDTSDCECETCFSDTMSYCDSRKQLMLEDLMPGGQYFSDDLADDLDSTNILRLWSGGYPMYSYISPANFKDESGKTDTVWINGVANIPPEMDVTAFVEHYKESWADALFPYHPEYCYYKFCMDSLQASYVYDEAMGEIESYDTAEYYGYLNPLGNFSTHTELNNDPLFIWPNGTNKATYSTFEPKVTDLDDFTEGANKDPLKTGTSTVNLWQFAMATGYCENISDSLTRETCFKYYYNNGTTLNNWMNDEIGRDNYWNKFRSMYFQIKSRYVESWMNSLTTENGYCKHYIGRNLPTTDSFHTKVSHFIRYKFKDDDPYKAYDLSNAQTKTKLTDSLKTFGTCETLAAAWDEALSLCANYSTHRDSILYWLKDVCKKGSTNPLFPNALGTTDIPPPFSTGQRFKSFEAVLKHFIGSNYKTELCNIDLISAPRSYTTDYDNDKPQEANECICNRVKEEIQQFKGCYRKKDSLELSTQGLLVNDFINALVDYNRFNDTNIITMNFGKWTNIANKLFVPVLGGTASSIKLKLRSQPNWLNERTFVVYNGSVSNGCTFSFRMDPNTALYTGIDTSRSAVIKSISPGVFSYRLYKLDNSSHFVTIYNTCFNNIGKCDPSLAPQDLEAFAVYFNSKYFTSFSAKDIEMLVGECGWAGFPNIITDKTNTYYLRYGSCPAYYRNYKEPKDKYMINVLNEMMRDRKFWWKPTAPGIQAGDSVKRFLTTDARTFHCSPNRAVDFLTQANDYHLLKDFINTVGDNYWWRNPTFTVSSFVVGGNTYYDTIWSNNYNNHPHFVGGFWIGAVCDVKSDSTCFTSFGDPFKQLGTGPRPTINEIDSLNHYRWSEELGSYIITAYNRSHPTDSVTLTIKKQCKAECNPLVRYTEVPVMYKDVFITPGSGGMSRLSNVTVNIGHNDEFIAPFMDMMKGLTKTKDHVTASPKDIRLFRKTQPFSGYWEGLFPESSGSLYTKDQQTKHVLTGKLGGGSAYCKFSLRKTGSDTNWVFDSIRVVKQFTPDTQAIAEGMKNNQVDMAGYHFTLMAGDINGPGDTAWHFLKGWSSCWKFFEISSISAEGKALFYLPEDITANCNCLTCPETKRWADSLFTEYPKLHPSHPNYQTVVANYINRKLNTSLSFIEIQAHWDECGVGNRKFIPLPQCDYRLSVKNSDCAGHADTMLAIVMQQTEKLFTYTSTKYSDSTEYCLVFTGYSASEIRMLHDSIGKYFSSPYCSAFKNMIHYRKDWDIVLYNLDSANTLSATCSKDDFETWFAAVKTNLFSSSSDLSSTVINSVVYSEDNFENAGAGTWMARIEFSALSHMQRLQFMDTLEKWTRQCGGFEIRKLYYTPQLVQHTDDDAICLISAGDTTCYACDTIRGYMENYQHDSLATSADLKPEIVETYLRNTTGKPLEVYDGASDCPGCSNRSLYVCEEPSDKLQKIVRLLSQVARNKKLNSANYALNSSYTSLLNALKPEGTVLNAPAYKYAANEKGGWNITIRYNTTTSDMIFVSSDTNDFFKTFNAGIDTFIQPRPIATQGTVSSFSIQARDSLYRYFTFNMHVPGLQAYRCCTLPATLLCPRPYTREYDEYEAPCGQEDVEQAIVNATLLYEKYMDSIRRDVSERYQVHCLSKANETIKFGNFQQRYHSTLYYYDQAGNLVRTVPPLGVTELNLSGKQDSINTYRNGTINDSMVNTWHTYGTNYRYNALNQLIWQKTPDGGISQFWYDRLGRLVLSQNAVQAARSTTTHKIYSYTKYDNLGRISEVGEISHWAANADSIKGDVNFYHRWLAKSTARTQITKTFYDYTVMTAAGSQFSEGQRNLRGRVSTIAYYDGYASDSTKYSRATHYSYDIHGNVDHLVHDFPDMYMVNSRYKHLTYTYDLISGKVHCVAYQAGQADQWFHRYDYDADNRLTLAETSSDSVIWDRDAEYKYYKHGPLARTLLGEHAVQGVDYAYTIHGWLKGVNSNTLQATRDIGQDGTGVLRKLTARDAYGFTLGYYNDVSGGTFDGDYKSIGNTSFEATKGSSPLGGSTNNMYNGNIIHMVSAVSSLLSSNSGSPLATVYRYDQLNRIKSVYTYNGINISTNSWNSGNKQAAWKETFKYDANGNITKLVRYNKTTKIDSLSYNYKSRTNQLTYVDDAVSSTTTTGDIDDESSGNYRYDKIGNLTYDRAEQIDSIYWNVYGKIEEIKRSGSSTKPALSFRYDAMGQRVLKIVKHGPVESSWDYHWYVRDAQGNVMATYTKKNSISTNDTSLYRDINNSLIDQMNSDSLAVLIKKYFGGSQFYTDLANIIINRGYMDEWVDMYDGDTLLDYDNEFAQQVLENFCDYYTGGDRSTMHNLIVSNEITRLMEMIDEGCYTTTDLLIAILGSDATLNELLNALATLDMTRFDQLYTFCVGMPPPPLMTTAAKIAAIRGNPDGVVANHINNLFSVAEIETILENASSTLQDNTFLTMDFCCKLPRTSAI